MDSSEECNNVYFSVRRDLLSLYFFKNTRTFYLINLITALFPIFFFFFRTEIFHCSTSETFLGTKRDTEGRKSAEQYCT